jgi:hypothetical protein
MFVLFIPERIIPASAQIARARHPSGHRSRTARHDFRI